MHAPDDTCRQWALPDEAATLDLGAWLAARLPNTVSPTPDGLRPMNESGLGSAGWTLHPEDTGQAAVIDLVGDLGAGKTTLVRGLLRKIGVAGTVRSPTYTLVEPYTVSGLNLYHFDFYRLTQAEEFLDAGLDEYFSDTGICLVEWPDKARPYLPPADWRIALSIKGSGRSAIITAHTGRGRRWLNFPAATSLALPQPA